MPKVHSSILNEYLHAFENPSDPFIFYYSLNSENRYSVVHEISRGDFLSIAKKAAQAIIDNNCRPGDRIAHCFGMNHFHDLAFRLAAALTGTIPVTMNWQSDTVERTLYKLLLTDCKMIVSDPVFNPSLLEAAKRKIKGIPVLKTDDINRHPEIPGAMFHASDDNESCRIIVFTSGTTGEPKGVKLSYRAFETNRLTFEQFLKIAPNDKFAVLIVNPMHHSNSTAITDWAMRRPKTHIHLADRYSTNYWKILAEIADRGYDRIVAPTVSRHFDFLENIEKADKLPVDRNRLMTAMAKTDFLIGSAPVGPKTIERLKYYTGRSPIVRFGSTETCLQVIGTPLNFSEEERSELLKRGLQRRIGNELRPGYYIGRPHRPYTEARIVRSINRKSTDFMKECGTDEDGYLITRGNNLMSGYVGDDKATGDVFHEGWYIGLKDICFSLKNPGNGELDYYWVSRESEMLIKGGANYAYDQVNAELRTFVSSYYGIRPDDFELAVVGLKLASEHEDSCCVTVEFNSEQDSEIKNKMENTFLDEARRHVSKGVQPDYIRFDTIPRNFKGSVLINELASQFIDWLKNKPS